MPSHIVLHRGEQVNGCHLFANPITRRTFSLSLSLNNDPSVRATPWWPFAALFAMTFGCLLSEPSRKRTHSVVSIPSSHSGISTIDVELGTCHKLIANVVCFFCQLCMHIRWCGSMCGRIHGSMTIRSLHDASVHCINEYLAIDLAK